MLNEAKRKICRLDVNPNESIELSFSNKSHFIYVV